MAARIIPRAARRDRSSSAIATGQDIRGCAFLSNTARRCCAVGLELPVLVFARHDDYSASTSIAPPRPPAMQIAAMPRLPFARF